MDMLFECRRCELRVQTKEQQAALSVFFPSCWDDFSIKHTRSRHQTRPLVTEIYCAFQQIAECKAWYLAFRKAD